MKFDTQLMPLTKTAKIYVSGHSGMVGSAIVRQLKASGYSNIITKSHAELDLLNQQAVLKFLQGEQPDYIFCAAAKVGGIDANNKYRADFIYQNIMMQTNIIHSAYLSNVQRLLFLGSSCVYPRSCPQPIREEYLLTSPLEATNEPYAVAKICGIKMCEAYNDQYGTQYVSVMPTNLYGPNDNYNLQNSHVLPALLRKSHEAMVRGEKTLTVWGSGKPMREFLHVSDMADACIFLMENQVSHGIYNIGTGCDISIEKLVEIIMKTVGYRGNVVFDISKPDGTPRKWLDISRMANLGWLAKVNLESGINTTYQDYLKHITDQKNHHRKVITKDSNFFEKQS